MLDQFAGNSWTRDEEGMSRVCIGWMWGRCKGILGGGRIYEQYMFQV